MPSTYYTPDDENFATVGATPTQVNHLVWQGLPGVYLAATNNGLMKTVDGGLTWDYLRPNATFSNTWPAGSFGRQISFSIGPRECQEEGCVCEDWESGDSNWTFSGSGSHALAAGPPPFDTSQTLHTVQGVSFTRLPIDAGQFTDIVELSLDVYNSNFHEANGTFTIQISPYTMAFALEWYWNHPNVWHFNGTPLALDALVDGQWNHLVLKFNQSTGQMISFTINSTTEDMSSFNAVGDTSQDTFDIVIDTFAPLPDLGGEFYFDNICICSGSA